MAIGFKPKYNFTKPMGAYQAAKDIDILSPLIREAEGEIFSSKHETGRQSEQLQTNIEKIFTQAFEHAQRGKPKKGLKGFMADASPFFAATDAMERAKRQKRLYENIKNMQGMKKYGKSKWAPGIKQMGEYADKIAGDIDPYTTGITAGVDKAAQIAAITSGIGDIKSFFASDAPFKELFTKKFGDIKESFSEIFGEEGMLRNIGKGGLFGEEGFFPKLSDMGKKGGEKWKGIGEDWLEDKGKAGILDKLRGGLPTEQISFDPSDYFTDIRHSRFR